MLCMHKWILFISSCTSAMAQNLLNFYPNTSSGRITYNPVKPTVKRSELFWGVFKTFKNSYIIQYKGYLLQSIRGIGINNCLATCLHKNHCLSVNFNITSKFCFLLRIDIHRVARGLKDSKSCRHYAIYSECLRKPSICPEGTICIPNYQTRNVSCVRERIQKYAFERGSTPLVLLNLSEYVPPFTIGVLMKKRNFEGLDFTDSVFALNKHLVTFNGSSNIVLFDAREGTLLEKATFHLHPHPSTQRNYQETLNFYKNISGPQIVLCNMINYYYQASQVKRLIKEMSLYGRKDTNEGNLNSFAMIGGNALPGNIGVEAAKDWPALPISISKTQHRYTSAFTIHVLFRRSNNEHMTILSIFGDSRALDIAYTQGQIIIFVSTMKVINFSYEIPTGKALHLLLTYDAENRIANIYLGKERIHSQEMGSTVNISIPISGHIELGGIHGCPPSLACEKGFGGDIYTPEIWDKALTLEEIEDLLILNYPGKLPIFSAAIHHTSAKNASNEDSKSLMFVTFNANT